MKLLHVTDIHFNTAHMDWILSESVSADVVCITGDFINSRYDCETPAEEQVRIVKVWLRDIKAPVLICSGNHDEIGSELSTGWLADTGGVFTDNNVVTLNGQTFGCAPFGCTDFTQFSACDVLLHHEPPAGLKVASQSGRDFGSAYLTKAIKDETLKLRWLLCGHVHIPQKHTSKFRGCCVSNPGVNSHGDIPNHHWINRKLTGR